MKFSKTAALAVGAATGAVAQWDDDSATTSTTTWDWTSSTTSATTSTTTSAIVYDWTTSSTDPGWGVWSTTSDDPKKSTTTSTTTSETVWGEWETTSSSTTKSKSTSSPSDSWSWDSEDPVCKATSTATVWAVGTIITTGTSTKTVYTTVDGGWSGLPIPSVVTETDTVTVWVGPGGQPISTDFGGVTTWTAGGGSPVDSGTTATVSGWVYQPVVSGTTASGWVYGPVVSGTTATGWVYDPVISGTTVSGWVYQPVGSGTTASGWVYDPVISGTTISGWVYDPTITKGHGGGWPAGPHGPTGSIIGSNSEVWKWTVSIPTQTSESPASPTYSNNCTTPVTGTGGDVGGSNSTGTGGNGGDGGSVLECNTADTRSSWCGGLTVDTDYYATCPDTGNLCAYTFDISNTTLTFDGDERLALAINGLSPGPKIECNWGDTVEITVTNNMQDNGTSIHWHGIRQFGTNNQDGVPGVTECALAPGSTRTYTWKACQYGTSWYHSHWLTQYGDGIRGPMVIHGPATDNYDIDMGPVMITELFNTTAAAAYDIISHTGPGGSANYLLNGVNTKPDLSAGKHALWQVQPGKKHLFRFINAAAQNMWSLHFDGHTMEVIAVDFVPIVPYTTEWLNIAIGQRYDVIITANQPSGNYFLRAVAQTGCPSECDNNGLGSANGIIQYADATLALPTSDFGNLTISDFNTCADEPTSSIVPWLVKTPGSKTAFSSQASTLPAGNVVLTNTTNDGFIFRWFLNNGNIDVDYTQSTLQLLAQNNNASISNALFLNNDANTWVYFVIQNQFFAGHPIHLHGHDFSVLGQLSGTASPAVAPTLFTSDDVDSLNFDNPPRRDTAMLAGNGWTVIGFETDNPGAWLMHCHIVWHVDGGLAMEFIERASEIDAPAYITDAYQSECDAYSTYEAANPLHLKTDGESGLRRRGWYEPEWMGQPESVVRKSESHEKRFLDSHLKRGLGDSYKPRHMRR